MKRTLRVHRVVFAFLFAAVLGALPSGAAAQTCFGLAPTTGCKVNGGKPTLCVGTTAGDNINGTSGNDVIIGLGGDDMIKGMHGADVICGGDGNDELEGGPGNDRLDGGPGSDSLRGDGGRDTCTSGEIRMSSCEIR